MLEARIIQINRLIDKIYVRFIVTWEDNERVLVFNKDTTTDIIREKITDILNELNEVELKKNEIENELKDLVITL